MLTALNIKNQLALDIALRQFDHALVSGQSSSRTKHDEKMAELALLPSTIFLPRLFMFISLVSFCGSLAVAYEITLISHPDDQERYAQHGDVMTG